MPNEEVTQPTDARLLDATRATVRELLRAPDAQSLYDTACRLAVEGARLQHKSSSRFILLWRLIRHPLHLLPIP